MSLYTLARPLPFPLQIVSIRQPSAIIATPRGSNPPTGIYTCEIRDDIGDIATLYAGVGLGNLRGVFEPFVMVYLPANGGPEIEGSQCEVLLVLL